MMKANEGSKTRLQLRVRDAGCWKYDTSALSKGWSKRWSTYGLITMFPSRRCLTYFLACEQLMLEFHGSAKSSVCPPIWHDVDIVDARA